MDKLIWVLFSVIVFIQASNWIFAPFFPSVAKDERGVSSLMIGATLSIESVSFVISSYIVGLIIQPIGRRLSIYIGLMISASALVGLGVLYWIPSNTAFIIFALFLRFVCGIGQSFVAVSWYAITAIKYKESLQQMIGILEAGTGAGFLFGPLFSGIIYEFTHYSVPFIWWAFLLSWLAIFLKFNLDEECDVGIEGEGEDEEVSYLYLMKHKRIVFASIAQFINIFVLTFGQPIFGPRMENDYGFSVAVIGISYALPCVTYALTGAVFLDIIAKNFEYRTTIMIGFIIIFAGGVLVGPSKILQFPDKNVIMMMVGIGIFGIGAAFAAVPIIPEMLDSVKQHNNAHDKVSVIYNISGGCGQIVAPLLAGYLTDEVGFNLSLDVWAIIVLSFLVVYFFFWEGYDWLINSFTNSDSDLDFNKFENESNSNKSDWTTDKTLKS